MSHLIANLPRLPIRDARLQLVAAHDFIADCCAAAISQAALLSSGPDWGIKMKRLDVDLTGQGRPQVVSRRREKFGEVVTMLATVERMIGALDWFERCSELPDLFIKECHPTTSSDKGGNDLVLVDAEGTTRVLCEVCDVASAAAGQNGKERKDVASLGCTDGVPSSDVRYFLCTSTEFAGAIQSTRRKVANRPYSYKAHPVGDQGMTVLVELVTSEAATSI